MGRRDLRAAASAALPVMLGYLTIGIPCGVMEAEAGVSPLWAFVVSATFYSGAGQFMMSSLALAGTPVAAMVASVSLLSARQTEDREQRKQLYAQFQQALSEDMPYTFLAYVDAIYVSTPRLKGIAEDTVLGHHGVGIFWNVAEWELEQ